MQTTLSQTLPTLTMGLILMVSGCAMLERPEAPPEPQAPVEVEDEVRSVAGWIETDAVVTLDSEALGQHFRNTLIASGSDESVTFRDVQLNFSGDRIGLDVAALLAIDRGEILDARLEGDILLSFSGNGLNWFPYIEHLSAESAPSDFDAEAWRRRVNTQFALQIVIDRKDSLGFPLQPPNGIELAAGLPGLTASGVQKRFPLQGAYTVAASMVNARADRTAIALDLEFVAGISHCQADFSISRSTFAGRIVNREPRDVQRQINPEARAWYYFTEVAEARRNLTLVHYWFADGRPVGISELQVEPSARWRTWSTMPIEAATARNIEVFAADRESGCIVDAGHIEALPVESPGNAADGASEDAFRQVSRGFPAAGEAPEVAVVEYSRTTVAEALNQSLARGRYALIFESLKGEKRPVQASLDSLAGAEIQCPARDCSVETRCRVDFSRCQRRQDTRDCTTCLFRNPLNNRCMSERVDEDCEAARARNNDQYETDWEACMAREESTQKSCEAQAQSAVDTCRQQAEAYLAACDDNRKAIAAHSGPVAAVAGHSSTAGRLALRYSDLEVVGDLARLKGLLVIDPELSVDLNLQFQPEGGLGALGQCIAAWNGAFTTRLDNAQQPARVAGPVMDTDGSLTASWPGMTVPLRMNRGPLEALLLDRPELLSACRLGLSPLQIGDRVSGEDGYFLRGVMPLDVQPGTARIAIPPMKAGFDGRHYEAAPVMDQRCLRYELEPIAP